MKDFRTGPNLLGSWLASKGISLDPVFGSVASWQAWLKGWNAVQAVVANQPAYSSASATYRNKAIVQFTTTRYLQAVGAWPAGSNPVAFVAGAYLLAGVNTAIVVNVKVGGTDVAAGIGLRSGAASPGNALAFDNAALRTIATNVFPARASAAFAFGDAGAVNPGLAMSVGGGRKLVTNVNFGGAAIGAGTVYFSGGPTVGGVATNEVNHIMIWRGRVPQGALFHRGSRSGYWGAAA